jgi:hypothetical protein
MKKLLLVLAAGGLPAAPLATVRAETINDPTPTSACDRGRHLLYFLEGYRVDDEQLADDWDDSGCDMDPVAPVSWFPDPLNDCYHAGQTDAYNDWLAFLGGTCGPPPEVCTDDGVFAGMGIARHMCPRRSSGEGGGLPRLPPAVLLCDALAQAECELTVVWFMVRRCPGFLAEHADEKKAEIESRCAQQLLGRR